MTAPTLPPLLSDEQAKRLISASEVFEYHLGACLELVREVESTVRFALAARGREVDDLLTVAAIAVASQTKMAPIMRAIREAGGGNVTANQKLTRDQALQAIAHISAPQPSPAGLTDEQIATMRSDAWLVFNASEASQEVRDVIEWYDGTLRAALTQEGSTK